MPVTMPGTQDVDKTYPRHSEPFMEELASVDSLVSSDIAHFQFSLYVPPTRTDIKDLMPRGS